MTPRTEADPEPSTTSAGAAAVSSGLIVIKVGGAVAATAAANIHTLAQGRGGVCVVHGAGPQITREMLRRGIPVEFQRGRRRTSADVLQIVRDSLYAVNQQLCLALGERAEPILGDREGLLAVPVPSLGQVGDPLPCRPRRVLQALANARIPVVAPIAVGPLNVNADDAAAALALGLGAQQLLFLSDVSGVLVDDEVLESISARDLDLRIAAGEFTGGIVPKLRAASLAANHGVETRIGATQILSLP